MANSTIFSLPFLVLCCAFSTVAIKSFNNETDLLSLLAIKSGVEDPLRSLISWNQTVHCCNWTGITCGRRHPNRVVGLTLSSLGLVGPLSPHVGNLSFLRLIDLKNNTFHGPIPQEISFLRRLKVVDFLNNSFTGVIPRNLSRKLVHLNLEKNNLSGIIPTDLSSLFKLKTLSLAFNKLSGRNFLQFVGNLTSLRKLVLISCSLEGEIPASLTRLERLEFLQLGYNRLTGSIPFALFNFSKLCGFFVFGNQLEGVLPSTLGLTLPNLVSFSLAENRFHGPIPASLSNASLLENILLYTNYFPGEILTTLGRLTRLRYILLSSNQFEENINLISSFTNSTNLEVLEVNNNLLTGSLPESIANFSKNFRKLMLGWNKVHGKIPSNIGNLNHLSVIDLSHNHLEGHIPVSIAKLSSLHEFDARSNRLSGVLPPLLGNLTSLLSLLLGGNNFSGNLPPSIAKCSKLLELDISRNYLNGLIPQEIMSISSLSKYLDLSNNMFEGSLPKEVGSLRNLGILDLSYNRLSGLIPSSLRGCSSLELLNMSGNLLEGEIPSGLSALSGLQYLSLSQNNLSGQIPVFLGKLKIQFLNLSFNRLRGEVPTIGLFKTETAVLLDGNEELCGGIPELNLTPCPRAQSQKRSLLLKILIPISAIGVIIVALFAALLCKKRMFSNKVGPSLTSFTGVHIMRLSYADLLKATGEFSEVNLHGVGRFGSVYKGILDDGDTEIAVKVLDLSIRGASKSFIAEYSALRNVRHRNLLKILTVCESIDFKGNDFKALIYEFKANGSLEKWLHQGEQNANLKQMINIAVDIAEGIEYLHHGTDSCIIHGDLKPSNILLDRNMTACVGDFGLSKFISDTTASHESNSSIGIRGTIGYVPPEYGMSCPLSTQGDAYSYGIVLLEMFTNKRPTDDLSIGHLNLHSFVNAALPDQVMEVTDPRLQADMTEKKKYCLASVLSIGVCCSKESPRERMSMTNVVKELHKILKILSRTR